MNNKKTLKTEVMPEFDAGIDGMDKESKDKIDKLVRQQWKEYPKCKPTEYGRYEVYRAKCKKQHYETWNTTGWAYNNNDITHFREIIAPV